MTTQQKQETGLAKIRQEFQSPAAINMFKDMIPAAMGDQAEAIAKRFAKLTYAAISQNPSLQKCSVPSLIRAASISASLDLDIDARGLAYLVPYNNEANFQIGYLGLIELAYRSGKVKAISAHCIYESEKDNVKIIRKDGQIKVEHPFSFDKPTGKMIAVYATAIVDGIDPVTAALRADEVEVFRKKSKAPNSPAWKDFYEAMAKKTVIRQLAKFLPKSILDEFSRGAAIDEREDYDTVQTNASETIKNQAGSEIITTQFEDDKQENQPPNPEGQEPGTDTSEPTDLPEGFGEPTEAEKAEKQAKVDEQKKALKESEGTKKPEFLYTCVNGHGFDVSKRSGKGANQKPICPKCLSDKIEATEDMKKA